MDGGRRARRRAPRSGIAVGGAILVAATIGALMLRGGHGFDPWTAGLTVPLTVAVATVARGGLRSPARAPNGLHDEVDAETGVGNGRAVLAALDRELERARSYASVFSLAVVEIDHAVFASMHPRRTHRLLADLLGGVARDVRLGDRVCRVPTSDHELVVVVLPDTGAQGVRTFVDRLMGQVQRHLATEGLVFDDHVRVEVMTHPDDLDVIQRLQRRLEVLDGADALIRDVAVRRLRTRRIAADMRTAPAEGVEAGPSRD